MNHNQLDLVFSALSDSTRRGMLAQLAEGETNITALAEPYNVSQPAISKHIRVLERAGLIEKTKHGRQYMIKANPVPAEHARDWIAYYTRFWTEQFDAVDDYLKQNGEST